MGRAERSIGMLFASSKTMMPLMGPTTRFGAIGLSEKAYIELEIFH